MPEENINQDVLPPEANDIVIALVTAIRIVKLYPSNNPVYSKTVKDTHAVLSRFLEKNPEYYFGVQKTIFTYLQIPVGKETDANRSIAQDLFAKGIRNITFCAGLTEQELLKLFQILAMPKEEIAIKSGVSFILWEQDISTIKITEAELDGIIKTQTDEESVRRSIRSEDAAKKSSMATARTLILDDLLTDPETFSAEMVELAKKTRGENETIEDRLIELYYEAARKIQEEHPEESEALFMSLAQSILSLDQHYIEAVIAGKLYAEMDSKKIEERKIEEQLPGKIHEILTGRFSNVYEVERIAELLKRTLIQEIPRSVSQASGPDSVSAVSLPADLEQIISAMRYTGEEIETLNSLSSSLAEADETDAILNTLLSLLPLVKNPRHETPDETDIARFDSVVRQLEELLSFLLKKQDYKRVALITNAFNSPVDPAFKPRMLEALTKTSSKNFIVSLINDIQNYSKDSPEYESTYSYLSTMEQETTEILLEMLADDTGKLTQKARASILELLKSIGKNQIAIMSDYLYDDRWHIVSGIINILSEIKSDEAIAALQKAANNKNVKIRQEVIKGLISIGGKKAAGMMAKFLNDATEAVQLSAIRGFADIKGVKAEDLKPLITFLQGRSLNKKDLPLTLEGIKALGKVGGSAAEELLKAYAKFQWWKSWSLQKELKAAAERALNEVKRRKG